MLTLGCIIGALVILGGGYSLFFSRPVNDNKIDQWDIINYVDVRIPILPPGIWHIDTYTKDRSNWLTLNLRDDDGNVLDSRTVNTTYRDDDQYSHRLWTEFDRAEFYEMLHEEIVVWALGYMHLRNKVA